MSKVKERLQHQNSLGIVTAGAQFRTYPSNRRQIVKLKVIAKEFPFVVPAFLGGGQQILRRERCAKIWCFTGNIHFEGLLGSKKKWVFLKLLILISVSSNRMYTHPDS